MSTITTRAGKGSPLTNTEVDNNFLNLNTYKFEGTPPDLTVTPDGGLNGIGSSGWFALDGYNAAVPNHPSNSWWVGVFSGGSASRGFQIASGYTNNQLTWRSGSGSWEPWRTALSDANFSSYALSLSGGTVAGNTVFSANGTNNTYRGVLRISNTSAYNWAGVAFPDDVSGSDTNANNYWFYGRGENISDRTMTVHIPSYGDYGLIGAVPSWGVYRTGAYPLFKVLATGEVTASGNTVLHEGNSKDYKSRSINAVRTTNVDFNSLNTAVDTFTAGTNYIPYGGAYNQPADGDHHYLSWGGIEGQHVWAAQIDINFYDDRMWFRRQYGADWQAWRNVIHDGNYSGYALPLSGGTVTGNTTIGRALFVNGQTGGNNGNELVVGSNSVAYSAQDVNLRPIIQAHGQYPVLSLNHTVTNNTNHGPTIQYTCNGTGYQFVHGTNGTGTEFYIGYNNNAGSNWNPHHGIAGYNPDGTTGRTFFEATTAGNIGIGAPGNWGGIGSGHPNTHLHFKGYIQGTNDTAARFDNLTDASVGLGTNGYGFSFQNKHSNHSWGSVAEFRTEAGSSGGDRPSISFTTNHANIAWSLGFVSGTSNTFKIVRNHGARPHYDGYGENAGWGTTAFEIATDNSVYANSGRLLSSANFGSYALPLTGGIITDSVLISRNNPAINNSSFVYGNNNIELRTYDSSPPMIGFHRSGYTAVTLYHSDNRTLRVRDANSGSDARVLTEDCALFSGSITGSFSNNTWHQFCELNGTGNGTFLLSFHAETFNAGGSSYNELYSGFFSIGQEYTNSTVGEQLVLVRGGHAPNTETFVIKYQRYGSSYAKLEWLSNTNLSLDNTGGKSVRWKITRIAFDV